MAGFALIFFNLVFFKTFAQFEAQTLSYLKTQPDKSFSKAELYKNFGRKTGKKRP
jgi:hypothetical protein